MSNIAFGLMSGGFLALVLALQAALSGGSKGLILLWVTGALASHLVDLSRRWSR